MSVPQEILPLLSLVADRTTDSIVLTDREQRILWVNGAFERLSGYRLEEVKGKVPGHFLQSEKSDLAEVAKMHEAVEKGERCEVELMNRGKNGRDYLVKIDIHPIRGEGEEVVYFVSLQRDVTATEQVEAELKESRDKFQSLVASIPGVAYRRDAGRFWQVLYMSSDIDSVVGYPPEVFVEGGKEYVELIYPEDVYGVEKGVRRGMAAGEFWEIEYRICHPKKGVRWVYDKGHAIYGEGGKVEFLDGYLLDITDRKMVEETLKSERNLFSSGPVCVIVWGIEANWPIRYISSNVVFLLGYSVEEMMHPDFRYASLIHPEDLARITPEVESNIKNHVNTYEQSYRMRVKDGYYAWFYDFTELVRDEEGKLKEIRGYLYDQTQQKVLEEALLRKTEELERYFTSSLDLLCIADVEGHFLRVNPQWEASLGYRVEELEGRKFLDLVHPEDLEGTMGMLRRLEGQKEVINFENRYRAKDGGYRWIEWKSRPEGKMIYAVARDITDRKAVESRLRESNKRYDELAEQSRTVTWEIDAEGKYVHLSPVAERLFGYCPEEVVGKKYFYDLHPEKDREEFREMAFDLMAKGIKILDLENPVQTKGGNIIWVNTNALPVFGEDGRLKGYRGGDTDITDRKEAESLLRESNRLLGEAIGQATELRMKAEEANRAKSAFLATMSHELRTPMNAVIGMTSLLQHSHLDEDQEEFVSLIRVGGETLLALINDILDFSKIEAGQLDLDRAKFGVRGCVMEVLEMLVMSAGENGVELSYCVDAGSPEEVWGDRVRLKQVLTNLVSNAIKFTEDGEVSLRVRAARGEGEKWRFYFSVKDTGIGMSEKALAKMFQPFMQADSSVTRRFGGTGLGLSICKRIVEAMGGEIRVTSEEGQGSEFSFFVDWEVEEEKEVEKRESLGGKRVVVVDDSETAGECVVGLLERMGVEVERAVSGEEAMRLMEKGLPDLLVVDQQMPEMDGVGFVLACMQKFEREFPPVILTTIEEVSEDAEIRDFFSEVIAKPVRARQFCEKVEEVLRGEKKEGEVFWEGVDDRFGELLAEEKPLSILVVDDNVMNQLVIVRMLKKLGYEPRVVMDGEEAVDFCRKEAVDLVFMDLQMPKKGGFEAVREIRADEGIRQPYIVALTAGALVENREQSIEVGMDDFLPKPIKMELVYETIQKVFAGGERDFGDCFSLAGVPKEGG